ADLSREPTKPPRKCYLSFFFSSRRRHTRFKCDWSSDVCSSDLASLTFEETDGGTDVILDFRPRVNKRGVRQLTPLLRPLFRTNRSEERRVGKECRPPWTRGHETTKEKWGANEHARYKT